MQKNSYLLRFMQKLDFEKSTSHTFCALSFAIFPWIFLCCIFSWADYIHLCKTMKSINNKIKKRTIALIYVAKRTFLSLQSNRVNQFWRIQIVKNLSLYVILNSRKKNISVGKIYRDISSLECRKSWSNPIAICLSMSMRFGVNTRADLLCWSLWFSCYLNVKSKINENSLWKIHLRNIDVFFF